jgi:hypothetical protein
MCIGTSKSTGRPCRKNSMNGQRVCRNHGGGTPQARASARERLAAAAPTIVDLLVAMAKDPTVPPRDRERAMRDLLDRVPETAAIQYTHNFGQHMQNVQPPSIVFDTIRQAKERLELYGTVYAPDGAEEQTELPAGLRVVDAEIVDDDVEDWSEDD